MITVKELIQELQTLDPELPVIMSTDDEGNGHRYIDKNYIGVEGFNAGSWDCDIEVGIEKLTPELEEQGYTEEDVKEFPCVVLG